MHQSVRTPLTPREPRSSETNGDKHMSATVHHTVKSTHNHHQKKQQSSPEGHIITVPCQIKLLMEKEMTEQRQYTL
jgi:hypothetical protein